MHKTHCMPTPSRESFTTPLLTGQADKAIINLRGDSQDPNFFQGVQKALNMPLPVAPCRTLATSKIRVVWVGPNDWFVIGPKGEQADIERKLRTELSGQHCAVTDVSSGYFLVTLSGVQVREILAQACPMDFHPAVFKPGKAVGTNFFKIGIYVWQRDETPTFDMLVRRSFIDHFWQLIDYCALDFGWAARQEA